MIIAHDGLHVWPCLEPETSTAISRPQVLREDSLGRHRSLPRPVRDRQSCFWEGEDEREGSRRTKRETPNSHS